MRLPTAEAYGTLLMNCSPCSFLGTCSLESLIPCLKGNIPFLESCMENLDKILSMYEAWDSAIALFFLSLIISTLRNSFILPKLVISNLDIELISL